MMLEMFIGYYGLDWAAMIFTFISLYRLGNGKRDGFMYGLCANVCWAAFGILAMSIANPIANVAFFVLNIRGYRSWRRANASGDDNNG